MIRPLLILLACLLSACQTVTPIRKPVYEGGMTYPLSQFKVTDNMTLTHRAGPPCDPDSTDCTPIGPEGNSSHSIYELRTHEGQLLGTAPSMLHDPKYDSSDFREYNRLNDQISLHASPSGRSILIVEDRSPAFPCCAYILLQRNQTGAWSWSDLRVKSIREPRKSPLESFSVYGYYPKVASIDDTCIFFQTAKDNRRKYKELVKPVN